jgi:hypothetical protein
MTLVRLREVVFEHTQIALLRTVAWVGDVLRECMSKVGMAFREPVPGDPESITSYVVAEIDDALTE